MDYERLTADPASRFQSICERIGRNAKERGLTDEMFNDIMAQIPKKPYYSVF